MVDEVAPVSTKIDRIHINPCIIIFVEITISNNFSVLHIRGMGAEQVSIPFALVIFNYSWDNCVNLKLLSS